MKIPLIILTLLLLIWGLAQAQSIPQPAYTNEQIANAIFWAEGGHRTRHPYGILAHYKHTTPRQACLNTISHARKDWNGRGDFLEFLSKRYAPINCDTDNGTNKFWLKNVRWYLRRQR